MAILFVRGINDLATVGAVLNERGELIYLMRGNTALHEKLKLKPGVSAYLTLFGKGVRQDSVSFNQKPSLIVNQICDADTNRGSLERCIDLCNQVGSPVINKPEKVLLTTRDGVSKLLQGIPGVTMPTTLRLQPKSPADVLAFAEAEKMDFPFIVRLAGDHGGVSMVLVRGREDHDLLHVYPFDGRDFYLTEFVDHKDESGFYHKHRVVVIDGEPMMRHAMYDLGWMVHSPSREFMAARESWDDDRRRMRWLNSEVLPSCMPAIREISKRLDLEYFGMDCVMRPGGEMLIFEVNAAMNILHNPYPAMNETLDGIHDKIRAMLERRSGEALV